MMLNSNSKVTRFSVQVIDGHLCNISYHTDCATWIVLVVYLEASSTELACKWFESRVFSTVSDQVGRLAERFTAHDALVRFLA